MSSGSRSLTLTQPDRGLKVEAASLPVSLIEPDCGKDVSLALFRSALDARTAELPDAKPELLKGVPLVELSLRLEEISAAQPESR